MDMAAVPEFTVSKEGYSSTENKTGDVLLNFYRYFQCYHPAIILDGKPSKKFTERECEIVQEVLAKDIKEFYEDTINDGEWRQSNTESNVYNHDGPPFVCVVVDDNKEFVRVCGYRGAIKVTLDSKNTVVGGEGGEDQTVPG
tara:strand:+ start:542 stop:967 length:426 start_codon:yes stop_codon:yes gene_type:complete